MSRVLISTSSFGVHDRAPLDRLEAAGVDYRLNPHGRRLAPSETRELLRGAAGLIAGTERLDRAVLEAAPDLRVISRCGAGLDNVDLEVAAELGIAVRHTPEAHVEAVAELALAAILDLSRGLSAADRALRDGRWQRPPGRLLGGKTVGIVGLGRVGRRLVELLAPFRVRVLAHDPRPDPEFARRHQVRYLPLEELLAAADVVSLHLPAQPGGAPLLDRRRLAVMKPSALLINTARGGLVDEAALAEALDGGRLAGAHLDVFAEEPYDGPLRSCPAALLTPHLGGYAAEARSEMELQAVENLLACLAGEAGS